VVKSTPSDQLMHRVREIVAAIFDVPLEDVTPASSSETIEAWDSLGRLVLTVELEQEFGVQVTPEETEQLSSVSAIVAWLSMYDTGEIRREPSWAG
jgi:acyl carrier protein